MTGDPAIGEHENPTPKPAQVVLPTPGPKEVKSKCKFGLPVKVMKSLSGSGVSTKLTSLICPCTGNPNGPPPVYVTLVPEPVMVQPAGKKTIVVADKVTPPPAQDAILSTPAGAAFAGIDRTNTPKMAKVSKIKRFIMSLLWANAPLPHCRRVSQLQQVKVPHD
jgi:hypothetical protein